MYAYYKSFTISAISECEYPGGTYSNVSEVSATRKRAYGFICKSVCSSGHQSNSSTNVPEGFFLKMPPVVRVLGCLEIISSNAINFFLPY